MNGFNFTQWLAIVGPIAIQVCSMCYLLRKDMKQQAAHHRENVNNMITSWKKNQGRWVQCNLRNEQVFIRMEKTDK